MVSVRRFARKNPSPTFKIFEVCNVLVKVETVPIEAKAVKVLVAVLRTFNELTFIVLAWALFKNARFVAERSCVRKERVLIFILLIEGAVREFVREIVEPRIDAVLRFVVLTQGAVREFVRAIVEPITEFVLIVFVLTLFAYT
jgi:hypothetical protein